MFELMSMHTPMHMPIHMSIYESPEVFILRHAHVYTHVYTHVHTQAYTHIYKHAYTHGRTSDKLRAWQTSPSRSSLPATVQPLCAGSCAWMEASDIGRTGRFSFLHDSSERTVITTADYVSGHGYLQPGGCAHMASPRPTVCNGVRHGPVLSPPYCSVHHDS